MSAPVTFSLVAGEASGDLLAGLLLQGMRQTWPEMRSTGIGGPRMAQQGFEAWWPYEKLAVRGYVEVLRHYREIVGIRQQLKARLLAQPPSVFIGVDAPDFNLDLEHDLKASGIPTVHFVCPSIWAWRADRVDKIRRSVDHVLCIFPFEKTCLKRTALQPPTWGIHWHKPFPNMLIVLRHVLHWACHKTPLWSRYCRAVDRLKLTIWRIVFCRPRSSWRSSNLG